MQSSIHLRRKHQTGGTYDYEGRQRQDRNRERCGVAPFELARHRNPVARGGVPAPAADAETKIGMAEREDVYAPAKPQARTETSAKYNPAPDTADAAMLCGSSEEEQGRQAILFYKKETKSSLNHPPSANTDPLSI
jgi:hypothetical protein